MAKAFMYVLKCADDTLYTGYTTDLKKRIATHNSGKGAKYTRPKSRRPATLLYAEAFDSKEEAMQAEYAFKQQTRTQKLTYITTHKETFKTLFNSFL